MCNLAIYAAGVWFVWLVLKGGVKVYQDSKEIEDIGNQFQIIMDALTGRTEFHGTTDNTNHIFIGDKTPINAKEGDIWLDTKGPNVPHYKVTVTEENSTDWLIQYIEDELERETRK